MRERFAHEGDSAKNRNGTVMRPGEDGRSGEIHRMRLTEQFNRASMVRESRPVAEIIAQFPIIRSPPGSTPSESVTIRHNPSQSVAIRHNPPQSVKVRIRHNPSQSVTIRPNPSADSDGF